MAFVIIVCVVLLTQVSITSDDFKKVSEGNDVGFDVFVSLQFSIFSAEVLNLAFWQRIYAAKDVRNLRIGFLLGGGIISLLTLLFGISCLVLKANDMRQNRDGEGSPIFVPAFTFFETLDMPDTTEGLRALIFVLAVCMIASCADSFQTAITSVIARSAEASAFV